MSFVNNNRSFVTFFVFNRHAVQYLICFLIYFFCVFTILMKTDCETLFSLVTLWFENMCSIQNEKYIFENEEIKKTKRTRVSIYASNSKQVKHALFTLSRTAICTAGNYAVVIVKRTRFSRGNFFYLAQILTMGNAATTSSL